MIVSLVFFLYFCNVFRGFGYLGGNYKAPKPTHKTTSRIAIGDRGHNILNNLK